MSLADIIKIGNVTAKKYAKGETIFSPGDSSKEGICLVLAGSAETQIDGQTKDKLFSREYQPGGIFGLLAVIGANRVKSAIALVDDTKILFINENDFKRYLKQDDKFLANLFTLVLTRLESVHPSQLKAPERKMDVKELLGDKAATMLEDIRRRNLGILDYLNKTRSKFVSPGTVLFDDQELDNSDFYLLIEGEIEQFKKGQVNGLVPVNTIKPGQIFGFLRGSNQKGHALVARAGDKTAKVVILDRSMLIKLAHIDNNIALSIFQNMILMAALVERGML